MKVNLFAMPTVPATLEEREELRPIGRNPERYQMMLDELRNIVKAADGLGITSFGTTEHHLHTEGGEANPNPLLMFSHLASITEQIKFIPLSIVLTAQDPIRVAEDLAMFDHMYPGRVSVCFARGYQKRWLQILSQRINVTSWVDEESDRINREIFDEHLEVLLKAWSEDAFDYNGKHYQVPFPYETGITGWAAPDWTRRYGADGELDDDDVIRKIGVIPKPLSGDRLEIFVPFGASPKTLYNAAEQGFVALMAEGREEQFANWCQVYREKAAEAGHERALGEGIGAVRTIALGDSFDEAFDIGVRTSGYEWHNYFNKFGGATEAFRTPEDDPDKMVTFADEAECLQRMIDVGHALVGTPDQIKEQMEGMVRCYADGHVEWLSWNFFAQGILPYDEQLRQLELFAKEVWPAFK